MNKDLKFEKKVLKPVVKEVKKYRKKYHSTPDEKNLGHLKIQTANLFVRILSGFFGIILVASAVYLFIEESFLFGIILILIGGLLSVLGIRGRKRELQRVLDTIDLVDGIGIVIDALTDLDL